MLFLMVEVPILSDPTFALGGNNIFGIFRKRRKTLSTIQEQREKSAASKGFAGPNGRPLTSEEAVADNNKNKSSWNPFDWFQQESSTTRKT